jgi:hypothetical protein
VFEFGCLHRHEDYKVKYEMILRRDRAKGCSNPTRTARKLIYVRCESVKFYLSLIKNAHPLCDNMLPNVMWRWRKRKVEK